MPNLTIALTDISENTPDNAVTITPVWGTYSTRDGQGRLLDDGEVVLGTSVTYLPTDGVVVADIPASADIGDARYTIQIRGGPTWIGVDMPDEDTTLTRAIVEGIPGPDFSNFRPSDLNAIDDWDAGDFITATADDRWEWVATADGQRGSLWFERSGLPSTWTFTVELFDHDFCLRTDNNTIYEYDGTRWNFVGNFGGDGRGIQSVTYDDPNLTITLTDGTTEGPFHIAGEDGAPGRRGSVWWDYPTNSPNVQALDKGLASNGDVWEYNGTIWVNTQTNLKGPRGTNATPVTPHDPEPGDTALSGVVIEGVDYEIVDEEVREDAAELVADVARLDAEDARTGWRISDISRITDASSNQFHTVFDRRFARVAYQASAGDVDWDVANEVWHVGMVDRPAGGWPGESTRSRTPIRFLVEVPARTPIATIRVQNDRNNTLYTFEATAITVANARTDFEYYTTGPTNFGIATDPHFRLEALGTASGAHTMISSALAIRSINEAMFAANPFTSRNAGKVIAVNEDGTRYVLVDQSGGGGGGEPGTYVTGLTIDQRTITVNRSGTDNPDDQTLTTAGQTQAQVIADIGRNVSGWARVSNTDLIPADKLTNAPGLTQTQVDARIVAGVQAWARASNTDKVPDNKIDLPGILSLEGNLPTAVGVGLNLATRVGSSEKVARANHAHSFDAAAAGAISRVPAPNPGNNKVWGTDAMGVTGWRDEAAAPTQGPVVYAELDTVTVTGTATRHPTLDFDDLGDQFAVFFQYSSSQISGVDVGPSILSIGPFVIDKVRTQSTGGVAIQLQGAGIARVVVLANNNALQTRAFNLGNYSSVRMRVSNILARGAKGDPGSLSGGGVDNIVALSQAAYDALATKAASTLYIINTVS